MNVKFYFTATKTKYDALIEKDPLALYFVTDEQTGCNYLYKGDKLMSVGHLANEQWAGLLSSEDYIELKKLIAAGGTVNLEPVDASVIMTEGKIGVQLSKVDGNALQLKPDGLYAVLAEPIVVPEYALERQVEPTVGSVATYRLKKTVGEEVTYVGDAIELGKEIMLQSGSLEVVVENGKPYEEAVVGDKYIDLVLNDEESSHIYIPVDGLVDNVRAGQGVEVIDNTVSVKLSPVEGNALVFAEDGGLFVPKCDFTAVEKAVLDVVATTYATKEEVQAIAEKAAEAESSYTWGEL